MFECLKSSYCLEKWFISNLTWEIIVAIFIYFFIRFIPDIIRAIKVSKFLLKQNRNTLGNAWGTHLADRFIDSWYSKNELESGQIFYKRPYYQNSRWYLSVMDKQLEQKNLVVINNNKIKPIKNFKNKIIIKILKFYLIHFIGDDKNYYEDIKK